MIRHIIAAVALVLSTAAALAQSTIAAEPRLGAPYYYDAAGVVPLRDYVMRLLEEKDRRDQQRFDAQEKALSLALDATKTAIAADFQIKLQDQNLRFVEKTAAKEQFDGLEGKVEAIDKRLNDLRAANEGVVSLWNILLAAFGTMTLAVSVLLSFRRPRTARR